MITTIFRSFRKLLRRDFVAEVYLGMKNETGSDEDNREHSRKYKRHDKKPLQAGSKNNIEITINARVSFPYVLL